MTNNLNTYSSPSWTCEYPDTWRCEQKRNSVTFLSSDGISVEVMSGKLSNGAVTKSDLFHFAKSLLIENPEPLESEICGFDCLVYDYERGERFYSALIFSEANLIFRFVFGMDESRTHEQLGSYIKPLLGSLKIRGHEQVRDSEGVKHRI